MTEVFCQTCYTPIDIGPIPMILFCPTCGGQHIDAPSPGWDNPPHRSHLCAFCGYIWRPADVPTTGVAKIQTRGKFDPLSPHELRDRCAVRAGARANETRTDLQNPPDRVAKPGGWLEPK